MPNALGEDKAPRTLTPKVIPDNVFLGVGLTPPDPADPSYKSTADKFEALLGSAFDPSNPAMYPNNLWSTNTNAFYDWILQNIVALIGNVEGGQSLGEIVKTLEQKLESNIDPNILLNIVAKILGPGIHNNGANGNPINVQVSPSDVSFTLSQIDAIVMRNGMAIYKQLGRKFIALPYSDRAVANRTLRYMYAMVVNNVASTATSFIESLPTVLMDKEIDETCSLFVIYKDDLDAAIDEYSKYRIKGEIIDLFCFEVDISPDLSVSNFRCIRQFDIQFSNNYHMTQLKTALSGHAVNIELPKSMLEEVNKDPNPPDNYITKNLGEILYVDPDIYPEIVANNPLLPLEGRELTTDEKIKYPDYVASVGNSLPADSIDDNIVDLKLRVKAIEDSINKLAAEWGGGVER